MEIFATILATACALLIPFGIYGLIRNNKTYHFMKGVLDKVSDAARYDIRMGRGEEWMVRFDTLRKVDYKDVVFSLKPIRLSSFWSREDIETMLYWHDGSDAITDLSKMI